MLDPACGTGGFLVATIDHWLKGFNEASKSGGVNTDDFLSIADQLSQTVETKLFGADFDPFLVRAATMNRVDRRGNKLYKRSPDGKALIEEVMEKESIRLGGKRVERILNRRQKIKDNDLPDIARAYKKFRETNKEPGT